MVDFDVLSREEVLYHFFEVMKTDNLTPWLLGIVPESMEEIEQSFSEHTEFFGNVEIGFAALTNVGHGVATLHLYTLPHIRGNFRLAAETLFNGCERLKQLGYRKVVVSLTAGNPFLKPNRQFKLGFVMAGILSAHVSVYGKLRDVVMYERFL